MPVAEQKSTRRLVLRTLLHGNRKLRRLGGGVVVALFALTVNGGLTRFVCQADPFPGLLQPGRDDTRDRRRAQGFNQHRYLGNLKNNSHFQSQKRGTNSSLLIVHSACVSSI